MAVMGILDNFQAPGDGWLGTDAGVFLIAPLDVRKMHTLSVLPIKRLTLSAAGSTRTLPGLLPEGPAFA